MLGRQIEGWYIPGQQLHQHLENTEFFFRVLVSITLQQLKSVVVEHIAG